MECENNCGNYNYYNGDDKISEGCGLAVDEELIKGKIDEFGNILNKHEDRITKIEVTLSAQSESLKYVIKNQENLSNDIKTMNVNNMQNHNAMLTGLNSLIINKQDNLTKLEMSKNEKESKVETAKIENKSKIYIQLFVFLGSLATVASGMYIAMK